MNELFFHLSACSWMFNVHKVSVNKEKKKKTRCLNIYLRSFSLIWLYLIWTWTISEPWSPAANYSKAMKVRIRLRAGPAWYPAAPGWCLVTGKGNGTKKCEIRDCLHYNMSGQAVWLDCLLAKSAGLKQDSVFITLMLTEFMNFHFIKQKNKTKHIYLISLHLVYNEDPLRFICRFIFALKNTEN